MRPGYNFFGRTSVWRWPSQSKMDFEVALVLDGIVCGVGHGGGCFRGATEVAGVGSAGVQGKPGAGAQCLLG